MLYSNLTPSSLNNEGEEELRFLVDRFLNTIYHKSSHDRVEVNTYLTMSAILLQL